jgi:hypothetical protein
MKQRITLVTVVYIREIENLKLQARSVAMFFEPDDISSILIVVNDRNQKECARLARELVHFYESLADRVRIVEPEEILPGGAGGFSGLLRRMVVQHRNWIPFRTQAGWRGNNGWLMQQAFKLCVARLIPDGYVLILDAKNFFVSNVNRSDFISEAGRALSFLEPPSNAQRNWMENSFRIFGLPIPPDDTLTPPSTTPYCLSAEVLAGCLAEIEDKLGPAHVYFGFKPLVRRVGRKASEFMLIYAFVTRHYGGWSNQFDEGLQPAAGLNRNMDDETVERMLELVEQGRRKVFSVHSDRLERLNPEHRARINSILSDRGLAAAGAFLAR